MAAAWCGIATAACGRADAPETGSKEGNPPALAALSGTTWQLLEIQSMDDAQGTERPSDPSRYTMTLKRDGTVAMRLNCNHATGAWHAEPSADPSSGRFEFGPLAMTRALCAPPSLDERVIGQAQHIRSYLLRDGRLSLNLMADGGSYVWEPVQEIAFETEPDRQLEAAVLKAARSYGTDGDPGEAGRARYVYGRVDLDGDGREEVFAYLLGPFFCGTGGCVLQLFSSGPGGYTLLSEFSVSRTPVIVSPGSSAGWRDFYRLQSGGGAPAEYVRLVFDGTRYVERERVPASSPPDGIRYLAGELTFDKAIPLERGAPAGGPARESPRADRRVPTAAREGL